LHDGFHRLRVAIREGVKIDLVYANDGSCSAVMR
jgi:hypothetical protein